MFEKQTGTNHISAILRSLKSFPFAKNTMQLLYVYQHVANKSQIYSIVNDTALLN